MTACCLLTSLDTRNIQSNFGENFGRTAREPRRVAGARAAAAAAAVSPPAAASSATPGRWPPPAPRPGRQLQSYTSVPRQFTSFSYQTRQAARTRQERAHRPPPKCVQRKRAAAARRLDTGAGDCGTYTALTPRVHVISLE